MTHMNMGDIERVGEFVAVYGIKAQGISYGYPQLDDCKSL